MVIHVVGINGVVVVVCSRSVVTIVGIIAVVTDFVTVVIVSFFFFVGAEVIIVGISTVIAITCVSVDFVWDWLDCSYCCHCWYWHNCSCSWCQYGCYCY